MVNVDHVEDLYFLFRNSVKSIVMAHVTVELKMHRTFGEQKIIPIINYVIDVILSYLLQQLKLL